MVVEAKGGGRNGRARNGADDLVRRPVQVALPTESREYVSTHDFWKMGTTTMFDIRLVNLNSSSYLHMTTENALEKLDKDKQDLYLQACLEPRYFFTPMVYSEDRIP